MALVAPRSSTVSSSTDRRQNVAESLENAIKAFEADLDPPDWSLLQHMRAIPAPDAVMVATAELDAVNRSRKGRSVATRLHGVLQSVREFTTVVDTFVSSKPEIAALVWGSVKLSMTVRCAISPGDRNQLDKC